ncbi:uncharacterized protein LOC124137947 isoform X7 [Haliotis rufescens]|uniref:uncharacterized protein LOC124137947 isoform X7 n=1 Tax=Haliotis rufescens TaxID=6454 RepID=UPI00201E85F0|nr:uncharacterized protein LOC124137947 isoform X7 [Haliotis rufescens]
MDTETSDPRDLRLKKSTRGHSVLRRGTFGAYPRRVYSDAFAPEYIPRRLGYESTSEEYALGSAVTNATSYSDASLYDTYDTANRSRGRDQTLLQNATAAIPPSTNSPLMASPSRTASALPGRRFLSRPITRSFSPDIDDTPVSSSKTSYSLPTSHLQASAPPRPNVTPTVSKYARNSSLGNTASRIASLKSTYDSSSSGVLPDSSSTRLLGGYIPRTLYRSGSPLGSGTTTPLYQSPYLGSKRPTYKLAFDSGSTTPTYRPSAYTETTKLLGGYVSPRFAYRTVSVSPYASGTQSPVYPSYSSRPGTRLLSGYIPSRRLTLSPSVSPYASGTQTPVTYTAGTPLTTYDNYYVNEPDYPELTTTRRRPKVLGTKIRVGNYMDRLRRKRAGQRGSSKYWPYYDVDDITSEAGDVLSETESIPDYYGTANATHWDDEEAAGGRYISYLDNGDDSYMDEPDEYVPFKPRRRLESPGVLELAPYENTPPAPELPLVSTLPYLPKISSDIGSKGSDLYLNSIVSSSAARARTAFKNNGFGNYDNASLVLSVEGDVVSPNTGGRYGFKYYHPPVPLVGRGLGTSVLGLPSPSSSIVDSFFGTYVNKLRDIRADFRSRLDSRVSPRTVPSAYREIGTYTPSKPTDNFLPYTSFRKRLQGGTTQRVDVIELPVSERVLPSETLSLTLPETASANDKDKRDSYKLTVLDKIKIKAAIVASKVEVEPRRKRPRSKFAADKLRTTRARGELPQLELRESPNKLDQSLDLPQLRRSLFLQESVYPQVTSGLSASRPPLRYDDLSGARTPRAMPLPSDRRAIRDVEGFTKPRNLLSWQYRLESRMDPADLIYKPGSFSRMREQVRDAHDKMDRHRQLLDRYLTDSGPTRDIQGSVQRKMEELERRDPSYRGPVSVSSDRLSVYKPPPRVVSQYGMPPKQPVSELRRRLRRTVCRSRGEPNYYRDRE